jgi:hypothetical protein
LYAEMKMLLLFLLFAFARAEYIESYSNIFIGKTCSGTVVSSQYGLLAECTNLEQIPGQNAASIHASCVNSSYGIETYYSLPNCVGSIVNTYDFDLSCQSAANDGFNLGTTNGTCTTLASPPPTFPPPTPPNNAVSSLYAVGSCDKKGISNYGGTTFSLMDKCVNLGGQYQLVTCSGGVTTNAIYSSADCTGSPEQQTKSPAGCIMTQEGICGCFSC